MKFIFAISLITFVVYLTINIVVGSYPVDKEAYDNQPVTKIKEIQIEREKSYMYKIQQYFIPIWKMNRYIYPSLILLCSISILLIWREKTHNKAIKKDN